MSIKLDMSKAYDRVKWSYLQRVKEVMDFSPTLIDLIIKCVSTTTFTILVNKTPKGHIVLSRELRQGDSLFTYLFLLCTEELMNLLSNTIIQGTRVCRGAPAINHLFFTDNSVIFHQVKVMTNRKIQELLKTNEKASRQHIKFEKRVMVFSKKHFSQGLKYSNGNVNKWHATTISKISRPSMIQRAKRKAF